MFLAGLLRMTELGEAETDRLLAAVLPELAGTVRLTRRQVNRIGGWFADVSLPHQHEHRTLEDILGIIAGSGMDDEPKRLASDTFTLLAKAEAAVHGMKPEAVRFHEVGALDSILDICMACVLFTRLSPARFVSAPCPLRTVRSFAPTASYPFRLLRYWNCSKAFPSVRSPGKAKP